MFREINPQYNSVRPEAGLAGFIADEALVKELVENNRSSYESLKIAAGYNPNVSGTNQQSLIVLGRLFPNIDKLDSFYSYYHNYDLLKPKNGWFLTKQPNPEDVYRFTDGVADIFLFETAVQEIAKLYGPRFLGSVRTNYSLVGPKHESGRHYHLEGYHVLSMPEWPIFVDSEAKADTSVFHSLVARGIHEYWHLIAARTMNTPAYPLFKKDEARPYQSSAQMILEEALCMWEELSYLQGTDQAAFEQLSAHREGQRNRVSAFLGQGKRDLRTDVKSRYGIGMELVQIWKNNGWQPGNLNGILAEANQFVSSYCASRRLNTLYEIPADYDSPDFRRFIQWAGDIKA